MSARKTAPVPPEIASRITQLHAAHARLPRPEAAGRRIEMPRRL
jgi:acyl-CoA thioester hydrolase